MRDPSLAGTFIRETPRPALVPPITLDRLRRDLEAYGAALAEDDYANAIGLQDDVDSEPIHARYAYVHSRDALAVVQRAAAEPADAHVTLRRRRLEMDVFGSVVDAHFATEEDRLVTAATKATVTVGGETLRWREVGERIRNEDDRATRRRWKDADNAVAARFLPREERLERAVRAFIAELGYPDDAARWEYASGLDAARLDATMQDVLARTESLYTRVLADWMRCTEGLALDEVEGHDVAHALRGKQFDAAFPKDALVPAWEAFVRGLGFDFAAMPNVTVDLADRPAKTDRAFVLAARVPEDVRLVTKPTGGADDWRALFHETAHALHYALTDPALPYEDRSLGEGGVTESYAFLFEHLLENPRFLAEVAPDLTGDRLREYLHACALDKLMGVRDYAAALHYDRWAATAPLEEQPERYVAIMTHAMKWPANPLHYLDTDGFDGAWYLRAWMLETAHRAVLEKRFGGDWWHHADAGAHLAALWRRGESLACEDVAELLDVGPLTMDGVLADAERLLGA